MPLFNNLPDLNFKGLSASLNPMNFFTDQPVPIQSQNTSIPETSDATETTPRAEPGPGPSSNRTITRRNAPPPLDTLGAQVGKGPLPMKSSLRPARPALDAHSASFDSIDGMPGRRKSSGTNVVILDPDMEGVKRIRKGSVLTESGLETRKRKKASALDTYIIVKPPPTASKNPLNLQVQLVVKTARGRDRAASSSVFSARSASTGSMLPSASSSPAKCSIGLPDSDNNSSSSNDAPLPHTPRSESPVAITDEPSSATLGADLARSTSLKSSVSGVSGISAKSTGTSASGTSSGKRIEPMFNLAVHNVMQPTVVTDAATDTKVAKFMKRQVDIAGVGVLEPCEVWLPVPGANPLGKTSSSSSEGNSPPLGRTSRPLSMVSFNTPLTPTISRNGETGKSKRGSMDIKSDLKNLRDSLMNQNLATPENAPKKFFGKLFKKKGANDDKSIHRKSVSEVVIEPASPNPDSSFTNVTNSTIRASVTEHHSFVGHATFGTAPAVVYRRTSEPTINADGAVTGLTTPSAGPSLQLASSRSSDGAEGVPFPMIPSKRPVGYTWTLKKWAKKNSDSWAAQLVAASAAGVDARMDDDVVFEWVKMKGSHALARMSTKGTAASGPRDRSKSRASTIEVVTDVSPHSASLALPRPIRASSPHPPSPNLDGRPKAVRTISARSSFTRPATPNDEVSTIATQTDDEAGYDSDPEDSETPWTCSVWIKKTNTRVFLGTLTPAPHHPTIVGMLKMPVGLQGIPLCEVGCKPTTSAGILNGDKAQRQKDAEKRIREEICITEEGLKDVICVSAMWLVAREEFGGLGKKKKN